jgi:hypothetical protein
MRLPFLKNASLPARHSIEHTTGACLLSHQGIKQTLQGSSCPHGTLLKSKS